MMDKQLKQLKSVWNLMESVLEESNRMDTEALSVLKKEDVDDPEGLLSRVKAITKPFINDPANKNNKHVPVLTRMMFHGNERISLDGIKRYYEKFMSNPSIKNKPIDGFTFRQLKELVDGSFSSLSSSKAELDEKDDVVYDNKHITIRIGDSKEKCIRYGRGNQYGFCISRSDASNLYHGYRAKGSTFYFIEFKHEGAKNDNAPEDLIVIHVYPNGEYMINYASPNEDVRIEEEEIVRKFPVLREPIEQGVLKYKEPTGKEKRMYEFINDKDSILELETADDKALWVEMGKKIKDREWSQLGKLEEPLLGMYVEVGNFDVPVEIVSKYPKLEKRYKEKVSQRVQIKLENGQDHYQFTTDEKKVFRNAIGNLENTPEGLRNAVMEYIRKNSKFAVEYSDETGWRDTPQEVKEIAFEYLEKNPLHAFIYTKRRGLENVPGEIGEIAIEFMRRNVTYSIEYMVGNGFEYTENEEVKEIALAVMRNDPEYAFMYIEESGWSFSPDEVKKLALKHIKKHPHVAKEYADEHPQDLPDEIKHLL